MTKKTTPPKFLQTKLNAKTVALVKKHMTTFLDKAKRDHNGKYMEPMQLLAQYIDHLGQFDRRFIGIDHSTLITTYKGVYDIYDPLRKRVQRLEEKNMPRSAK